MARIGYLGILGNGVCLITAGGLMTPTQFTLKSRWCILKLDLLIVGLSGFAGSITRYVVYLWFGNRNFTDFPWATLFVNILGCLLIGVIGGLVERSIPFHRHLFLIGSVGFLGAFTTFSAFGFETLTLLKNQELALALGNVVANVLVGVMAVWLGRSLTLIW